jgi:hypothetical protein
VASQDFAAAATVYARVGSLPDEALARLAAARHPPRDRADAELAAALAAFRDLGAVRFAREAEQLPALPA